MLRVLTTLVGCLLAAPLGAADIEIIPPRGEVVARCREEAKSYSWLVMPLGSEAPVEVERISKGREIRWLAKPQARYLIWLITLSAEGTLDSAQATYEPSGPGPGPEPDPPEPGPGPDPPEPDPLPDGKFGLAKWAYSNAQSLVGDSTARGKAPSLAEDFRAIASAIAAGGYPDSRDFQKPINDLQAKTRATLAESRDAWQAWSEAFNDKVGALWGEGKLPDNKALGVALEETALGLERVRGWR